jgi:uncharacterized protein YggE
MAAQGPIDDDRPKITVRGDAVVNVKPDKIVIRFGIETSDIDIVAAKQKNNEILRKSIAIFKGLSIPEKDIQTDYLSIQPQWKDDRREGFIGYFVRNTVVVTIGDASKVEEVVTRALESGINYIHGIDFQSTELKKYREQARDLALKAAKEKAEKMAAVFGESIGKPIQISEGYGGYPWRYWSGWSGWGSGYSQGMSQNITQNIQSESGESPETIALGKISISANVSVTFDLK